MGGGMNELTKRLLTGGVLSLITLFLMFQSASSFAVFIALAGLIIGYEFAKLNKIQPALALFVVFVALLVSLFAKSLSTTTTPYLLIALVFLSVVFWLNNFYLIAQYPNKKPSGGLPKKTARLFLLVLPLGFLMFVHTEVHFLLLLFLIVWSADSFAYFSGKAFGRRKLASKLSGGKTIEGAIGGLVGALLTTYAWMVYYNESSWGFLLIALVTGVFSIVGDLYESIYKREAGVKDSGNILPGHGGVFDRLDGLLGATPIFIASALILQQTRLPLI